MPSDIERLSDAITLGLALVTFAAAILWAACNDTVSQKIETTIVEQSWN